MSSALTAYDKLHPVGFWHRQFLSSRTSAQVAFDLIFGIALPIVCFYFDPGIIRGNFANFPHSIFIYTLSALAMLTLSLWLFAGPRVKASSAIIGGGLLSGAVCSFTIGIIILPLTLIGIFLIIGFLGFVPFVTGFVYLRNATRAIGFARASLHMPTVIGAMVFGVLILVGLPALGEFKVSQIITKSIDQVLTQDPGSSEGAVQTIKYFGWIADTDKLVRGYESEPDRERKDRLAKAYKEITGREIQERLRRLND